MSSYHVMFDGDWQQGFEDRDEALEWARAEEEPGRIVLVIRRGWRSKVMAVFPESRTKEGKRLWKEQHAVSEDAASRSWESDRRGEGFGGGI